MKKNVAFTLTLICTCWVFCAYLVYQSSALHYQSKYLDLCRFIFNQSCEPALKTSLALHWKFPLAGIGIAFYGLLGLLISLQNKYANTLALIFASIGTGIGIYLSKIIFSTNLTCPICLGIHFLTILILFSLIFLVNTSTPKKENQLGNPIIKLILQSSVLVIMGFSIESKLLKLSYQPKKINSEELITAYYNEKVNSFNTNVLPHIGDSLAKIQMVVFSSFQCPSCKSFANVIKKYQKEYGNQMNISFRNFPLSDVCNPRLIGNSQPQSCDAALASLAANKQGVFWKFHDLLFESDLKLDSSSLLNIAKDASLNIENWDTDRHSPEIMEQLLIDINLANSLEINATPTVFVNGRKLSNIQDEAIRVILNSESKK